MNNLISKWITTPTINDTLVGMYEEDLRRYILKLLEYERDPKKIRRSSNTFNYVKKQINNTVLELNKLTNSNNYDMFLQHDIDIQSPESYQEAVQSRIDTIDPVKMYEDFRNLDKFINDLKRGYK